MQENFCIRRQDKEAVQIQLVNRWARRKGGGGISLDIEAKQNKLVLPFSMFRPKSNTTHHYYTALTVGISAVDYMVTGCSILIQTHCTLAAHMRRTNFICSFPPPKAVNSI